jgi:hypothetical protein
MVGVQNMVSRAGGFNSNPQPLRSEFSAMMTYENAENGIRKNCRKWKMTS